MKIVFTGGGTAGHVMPNIALINQLSNFDEVFYFGTDGMEQKIIPQLTQNVNFVQIKAAKFKRKFALSNLLLPFRLWQSVAFCKKALKQIHPDVVFCKGGYVSLPVALAAKGLSIPIVTHESDVSAGLANKLCAKSSFAFLSTFELSDVKTAQRVGCPLRQEIYSADAKKGLFTMGFDGKKPVLLFLGGSLGANSLNALAQGVYPYLKQLFDIFVITGKGKSFESRNGLHCAEFCNDIFDVAKASAFCVTRGGANTLCELCVLSLPFLVIPLTSSSRGEQSANAEYFAKHGCGAIADGNISAKALAEKITKLFAKAELFKQSQKMLKIDGTQKTLNIIAEAANQKQKADGKKTYFLPKNP